MIIDCDSCAVRGRDCVVTFLTIPVRPAAVTDAPVRAAGAVELDAAERHAIGVLAASGLVPPLRLVEAG